MQRQKQMETVNYNGLETINNKEFETEWKRLVNLSDRYADKTK